MPLQSKTKPPPLPVSSAGRPRWKEKLRTRTVSGFPPEATLCGYGDRVGAVPAAFANGAVGHANDFDEYYAFGPLPVDPVPMPGRKRG